MAEMNCPVVSFGEYYPVDTQLSCLYFRQNIFYTTNNIHLYSTYLFRPLN